MPEVSALLQQVGAVLLELRQQPIGGEWHGEQLRTQADRIVHELLVQGLERIRPGLACISEEDEHGQISERPDEYWLIDPIDGTRSLAEGFDGFVSQVALMRQGRPVAGWIHAPALAQMYLARKGGGATLNGQPLHLRPDGGLHCLTDNYPQPRGLAARAMVGLGIGNYLECGSIALKICRVADGSADVFVKDVTVRHWDIAPAQLVLEEAGGWLSDMTGAAPHYHGSYQVQGLVATANPDQWQQVVSWLRTE